MRAAILVWAIWAAFAGSVWAVDVIHLKEGEPIPCEILELSDNNVRIKVTISVAGGEAFSTKVVPMASVAFIDFEPEAGEEFLLESGGVEDVGEIEGIWEAKRENLHRRNSNAGEVGLKLAELLVERGSMEDGKALYERVETGDWDEKRRGRARQGRLRVLLAMGEVDAAVKEALAMAEEGGNAEILMDAKYVLASADFDKLKQLEEENPKWDEDDLVRPERNQLYHSVLDQYLQPYLFHGADEAAASRGLLGAIEVYRWAGDNVAALARAKDLLALYPESDAAGKVAELEAGLAMGTDGERATEDSNERDEESMERDEQDEAKE
ncbi:MAG: hypothetical protein AAGD22_17725 [Verrucomicrobiota bacterium]